MKVLQVMLGSLIYNGISVVVMNISEYLRKKGIEVDILAQNVADPKLETSMSDIGIKVQIMNDRIKKPIAYSKKLKMFLKSDHYDIVHIHTNSATAALEINAVKSCSDAKIYVHSHSISCEHKCIDKIFRKYLYKNSDVFFACSKEAGRWLFNQLDFTVINNGLDVAKYMYNTTTRDVIREKYGIQEDEIVIGHIGRFNPFKNHIFIIHLFDKILRISKREYRLMFLGDGILEEEMKQKVKDLNIQDKVLFLGSVDNVCEVVNAIDIFIFPSLHEGFGIALLEAQANGIKCIASDNVPKETKLTDLVSFISLDTGFDEWIECIDNMELDYDRTAYLEKVKKSGYDKEQALSVLDKFYHC